MPTRSITLNVDSSEAVQIKGVDARRITLSLGGASNVTEHLFVVRAAPTAEDPDRVEFLTVAAAADLTSLQEEEPPSDGSTSLFRTNEVTLTTDDPTVVNQFIDDIQRRLKELFTALKTLDENSTGTSYTVTV